MSKDSTTIYVGDIKEDLEELKKRGYTIKDILKKGIEYIKIQENFPYNISELGQSIKELKSQVEMIKEFNLSIILLNKNISRLNKILKKKKTKKEKKGLLRRLINFLYG
jgi:ABC-type branched-subunit amino acid transport system substrate-binding protein